MLSVRRIVLTGLTIVVIGAGWVAKVIAQQIVQENTDYTVITYFNHEKVEASFAKIGPKGGSQVLWGRDTSQGTHESDCAIFTPSTCIVHTVIQVPGSDADVHMYPDFTAVVYVVSGEATFSVGGTCGGGKRTDNSRGLALKAGDSQHIGKGDMLFIPPGCPHSYKDLKAPLRYLMYQVPN